MLQIKMKHSKNLPNAMQLHAPIMVGSLAYLIPLNTFTLQTCSKEFKRSFFAVMGPSKEEF
jgi:hypothetical protein